MCDYKKTWYHGSPVKLMSISKGSTITQDINLARIFSHKPSVVSINDDGCIKHNGKDKGYLYIIREVVDSEDIYPHPNSSMETGMEWLINRDLDVQLVEEVDIKEDEILSEDEIKVLMEYAKNTTPNT